MPVYGAGSKRLGRGEEGAEWPQFHALHAPGNSHCAPTLPYKIRLAANRLAAFFIPSARGLDRLSAKLLKHVGHPASRPPDLVEQPFPKVLDVARDHVPAELTERGT